MYAVRRANSHPAGATIIPMTGRGPLPQDAIISAERLAENRLSALLNATPDGIILIDAYGRIEAFSPGAEHAIAPTVTWIEGVLDCLFITPIVT